MPLRASESVGMKALLDPYHFCQNKYLFNFSDAPVIDLLIIVLLGKQYHQDL